MLGEGMQFRKSLIYSVVTMALLPMSAAFAQQNSDYQAPRTEWGQPDLQGVWNFSSSIPMQRPQRFGEREFLTEEEIQQALDRRAAAAAAAARGNRVLALRERRCVSPGVLQ